MECKNGNETDVEKSKSRKARIYYFPMAITMSGCCWHSDGNDPKIKAFSTREGKSKNQRWSYYQPCSRARNKHAAALALVCLAPWKLVSWQLWRKTCDLQHMSNLLLTPAELEPGSPGVPQCPRCRARGGQRGQLCKDPAGLGGGDKCWLNKAQFIRLLSSLLIVGWLVLL